MSKSNGEIDLVYVVNEREHIALGVTEWVEPAFAFVDHDNDVVTAPMLDGARLTLEALAQQG